MAEADALASIVGNDFQLGFTVGGLRTFASVSEAFELAHQTSGGSPPTPTGSASTRINYSQSCGGSGRRRTSRYECGDAKDTYEDAATVDTNTPAMKYRTVGLTIIDTPQAAP